eukprot:TRINITY_DN10162_c0_g1_i1.p1 TRINITY_DN10162_c0_g1~~TRINITY_DN10162_c0_g1_i1.p1  ORF type:complete len:808 (+),score=333.31 TRINITY_DN10162_c0_g1_i1:386-2809(+)
MPLIPTFSFSLNQPVLEGLTTVGTYDGEHASLTCATTAGKVFIHDTHRPDAGSDAVRFLNINQTITAIKAGVLEAAGGSKSALFVGTATNLLAYDVDTNADLFYKEMQDGVSSLEIGRLGDETQPIVCIVGGNCSIQAVDAAGRETFFTMTGDNVRSLALCDLDADGLPELLAGHDDYEIRVFRGEEAVQEISESDAVVRLRTMGNGARYAYALANGTLGLYDGGSRVWKAKAKDRVNAIESFDIDGDGVPEVIVGWSSGKMEVRTDRDGAVIYSDQCGSCVSDIVKADYRNDGNQQIICVSHDGQVRGYLQAAEELRGNLTGNDVDEQVLQDLAQKKQELMQTLTNFDENIRAAEGTPGPPIPTAPVASSVAAAPLPSSADGTAASVQPPTPPPAELLSGEPLGSATLVPASGATSTAAGPLASSNSALTSSGSMPVAGTAAAAAAPSLTGSGGKRPGVLSGAASRTTTVSAHFEPNATNQSLDLVVRTSNGATIRAVVVLGEHVFEQESVAVHPRVPSDEVRVAFVPKKNIAADLHINAIVGARSSSSCTVFEMVHKLPKFAAYLHDRPGRDEPASFVVFNAPDRVSRIASWLQDSFMVRPRDAAPPGASLSSLDEWFVSLRTGSPLRISVRDAKMTIRTDDVEAAGDIIQDLCECLSIDSLESTAYFPEELNLFHDALSKVTDFNAVRAKLTSEMADSSNLIKMLVVKAEDARILAHYATMSRVYAQLYDLNRELIGEYTKRSNNFSGLLASLKEVNTRIQFHSRLRAGAAKTRVVNACRLAIKENNVGLLFQILKAGTADGRT